MTTPTTNCPACKGTGQVALSPALAECYALFAGKAKLTSKEIHLAAGGDTTPNAINNRLEILREMGLLTRKRDGRLYRYERAPKPKVGEPAAVQTKKKKE